MTDAQTLDLPVNITLHGFSLMLMLVLIVGMVRRPPRKRRRMLLAAMQLQLLVCLFALTGNVVQTLQLQGSVTRLFLWVATTACFLFGVLTFTAIVIYACEDGVDEPLHRFRGDRLSLAIWVMNSVATVAILTNPVTHAIFDITPDNRFVYGSYAWLVEMLVVIEALLVTVAIMRMRMHEVPRMTRKLVTSGTLLLAGVLGKVIFPNVSLVVPGVTLSLAMFAVGVQTALEEQLSLARMEATESRIRLLSGQIHPHFIFNSLNAIKSLIVEDPERAELAVQDFSDYLRSHLDEMSSSRLVPFRDEMGHVRHYVSLELADPGCPLSVIYDLEVEDFLIPPLTVQPLVENAIRHGIRTRVEGGTVRISSHETESAVVVEVADDGHGSSSATEKQNERRRVGIANVRERIERQCGGQLEVVHGPEGTVAKLILPKDDGR